MRTKEEYVKSEISKCEYNINHILDVQKGGIKEEFKNDPIAIENSKTVVEKYIISQNKKIEELKMLSDDDYCDILKEEKLEELFEKIATYHNTTVEEIDKMTESELEIFLTTDEFDEIMNLIK